MTLIAARDLSAAGIRVNTIAPGTINTPAYGKAAEQIEAYWGPQVPHPKRMGRPDEYAQLAIAIAENGCGDYLIVPIGSDVPHEWLHESGEYEPVSVHW